MYIDAEVMPNITNWRPCSHLFIWFIYSLSWNIVSPFQFYDIFCELWALFAQGKRSLLTELGIVISLSFGVLRNNTPRQLWFISVSSLKYLFKFRIRLRQWRGYGKYITGIELRSLLACNRNKLEFWFDFAFIFMSRQIMFIAVRYQTIHISVTNGVGMEQLQLYQ